MSASIYLNSEFDRLRIEAEDDGTLWIRDRYQSVSLRLSDADRTKLRNALDEAGRIAAQVPA